MSPDNRSRIYIYYQNQAAWDCDFVPLAGLLFVYLT